MMTLKTPLSKNEQRLYHDLAWTFPLISPLKHYLEETEYFCEVIRAHSPFPVKSLLHLGCGGGHNDYILKKYFQVTGVDIHEAMLTLARQLNPEAEYLIGDMRTVQLGALFEAVVALDAIAYMLTLEDLRKVFSTAFSHLQRGGIFLLLVEDTTVDFKQNRTTSFTNGNPEVEITFIENCYDPNPQDTTYETTFIYLLRRQGNLEIHTDRHLCGLFKLEVVVELLHQTGFKVLPLTYKPPESALEGIGPSGKEYYPLLVCSKPH